MKLICIYFIFFIFFLKGKCQTTFEKIYGNAGNYNYATSVLQTTDSGFMVLGSYNIGVPGHYPFILKINSYGDSLWQKQYCAAFPQKIKKSYDNDYVFVGTSVCPVTSEIGLVKVNSQGDTLWTRYYGFGGLENGMDFTVTKDSCYVIIADCSGTYPTLFKVDSLGNYVWGNYVAMSIPYSVKQTLDGGFIVAGGSGYWAIEKHDSTGAGQWAKFYGNTGDPDDRFRDVIQLPDSDFIVAGSSPYALVKINHLNGDTIWVRNFGGWINSVIYTFDNNLVVADESASIYKYDTAGNQIWHKTFPNTGLEDIKQTTDSGFIACGSYSTNGSTSYVLVIKTDSAGNVASLINTNDYFPEYNIFKVFPNPVTGTSQLNFINRKNVLCHFIIADVTGRIHEEKEIKSSGVIIEKGNKPAGIYFYSLINSLTGERVNGKFIVE